MITDELDKRILEFLREDSRVSLKVIAENTGKPVSTIHERIKKLVKNGILKKFTILIDYGKMGYGIKVLILINVDGKHIIDVENYVSQHSNVQAVYDITGEFDVAVLAAFKSMSELDKFVKWLLQNPFIRQTRTSIVFRVVKETIHLPLTD